MGAPSQWEPCGVGIQGPHGEVGVRPIGMLLSFIRCTFASASETAHDGWTDAVVRPWHSFPAEGLAFLQQSKVVLGELLVTAAASSSPESGCLMPGCVQGLVPTHLSITLIPPFQLSEL